MNEKNDKVRTCCLLFCGRGHEEEGSGRVQTGPEGRGMGRREEKGHECKRPREWQSKMAKLYRGLRNCGRET